MKKINFYTYITASLALLVPVPGRFAYGLVLVLALNIMMVFGTLFRKLVHVLELEDLQPVLIAVLLVCMSIICKQLLIMFSPEMALTVGYAIYMPAVSSFLIGFLYEKGSKSLFSELSYNMKHILLFSLFALIVFLFRDLFGYGTFTLPSTNGLLECVIVKGSSGQAPIGVFWASIPGALVITALCVVFAAHVSRRFEMVRNAGLNQPVEEDKSDAE